MAFRGRDGDRDEFKEYDLSDMKQLIATRTDIMTDVNSLEKKLNKANRRLSVIETVIEERDNNA